MQGQALVFDSVLKKSPTNALRSITPNSAYILYIAVVADVESDNACSPDNIVDSSPEKRSSQPMDLLPPHEITPLGFSPMRKIPH